MFRQIKNKLTIKKLSAFTGLVMLVVFSVTASSFAQTVTQGYSSDKILQRGTVVSLDTENTSKVMPTDKQKNQDRIHGVVVAPNDSTFTLSDDQQKTFVANVGRFDVLVSTEAGIIQPGDFLTVSSIPGIAMKAGEKDAYSIGKAIEGFDGSTKSVTDKDLEDSLGNISNVKVGRIAIDISIGFNPLLKPQDSTLPEYLQKATDVIAGKQVSPVRVYVSLFIILASAGVAGSLLYSGVKTSFISIGRNPLSKKSITKSLFQIILTSIIIFLIGLFGVYLLLRL